MLFAETSITEQSKQPYKFGGKELDQMHGLNFYDVLARYMDGIRFTGIDPMAEKYYSISPYVYCANNPLKFIDPDGRKLKNSLSLGNNNALLYIAKIAATSQGNILLSTLINSKNSYTLSETVLPRQGGYNSFGSRIIHYPAFTLESVGATIEGGSNKTEYWIGHEGFHAFDQEIGTYNNDNKGVRRDLIEGRAVSFENYLRQVYNDLPYRTSYGIVKENFFQFANPTEKVSDFKFLGNNTPIRKFNGVLMIGASYNYTIGEETTKRYIIVSQDKRGNITYKFYDNEEDYNKETKDW